MSERAIASERIGWGGCGRAVRAGLKGDALSSAETKQAPQQREERGESQATRVRGLSGQFLSDEQPNPVPIQ